jgi:cytochrome c oxidase subunit 3
MSQPIEKSTALRLGLLVFIGLALLTAVEFAIALLVNFWQLLLLVSLFKAGLVLVYYMHVGKLFQSESESDQHSYAYKLLTNRIGLWLFLISDAFIFGGLLIARINLLGLQRPELSQVLGLIVTSVLLVSSFFMNRAESAMAHGDRKQFALGISVTLALGLLFLVGVVGVEWRIAPFGPQDGVAGAVFYSMTGFHAFHVFTGVIFLFIVLRNGLRGRYSAEKHWGVEACAIYWHFVDVVWIFFYPALYLIGTVLP